MLNTRKKRIRFFANLNLYYYLCTKSLHFEALHGDKEGRYSIKANDQYRIEFTLAETDEEPVVTICNIMELSNHYK